VHPQDIFKKQGKYHLYSLTLMTLWPHSTLQDSITIQVFHSSYLVVLIIRHRANKVNWSITLCTWLIVLSTCRLYFKKTYPSSSHRIRNVDPVWRTKNCSTAHHLQLHLRHPHIFDKTSYFLAQKLWHNISDMAMTSSQLWINNFIKI
jgi:hypothetical protein